jgi:hypothetical protein
LQFLVSTGRHHGFESLAEARLLLALDFAGDLVDVLAQPFRLRYSAGGVSRDHVPDFLAFTRSGRWLIDVRPADRVGEADLVTFAAAAEVALLAGWRYAVVTGWRSGVIAALDALSAQRRPLTDRLSMAGQVEAVLAAGPSSFAAVADATTVPPIARAFLLHMLWHRRLGVDLSVPLGDASVIRLREGLVR